jgi:hypothetical protein
VRDANGHAAAPAEPLGQEGRQRLKIVMLPARDHQDAQVRRLFGTNRLVGAHGFEQTAGRQHRQQNSHWGHGLFSA